MPEPDEPLPVALPEVLGVAELLDAAVLSFALPCASLQCVAAEILLLAPAPGVPDDCAAADCAATPTWGIRGQRL